MSDGWTLNPVLTPFDPDSEPLASAQGATIKRRNKYDKDSPLFAGIDSAGCDEPDGWIGFFGEADKEEIQD